MKENTEIKKLIKKINTGTKKVEEKARTISMTENDPGMMAMETSVAIRELNAMIKDIANIFLKGTF